MTAYSDAQVAELRLQLEAAQRDAACLKEAHRSSSGSTVKKIEMIDVPLKMFQEIVTMAAATHQHDDCQCEEDVLQPARHLIAQRLRELG